MKSTSICGYTYHCGLTESALCAHRAQMWHSSAEAYAHWKYFYRTAVWLSCSVKSLLNIDFVFYYFPHWKTIPIAMVNGAHFATFDWWITFRFFYVSRWPEPPKCHSWHRILGKNAVFTFFNFFFILNFFFLQIIDFEARQICLIWSCKDCQCFCLSLILNYHDILYSNYSDTVCLAVWGKSHVCSGTHSQCCELFVKGT